jgi:acyl carrier protein
MFFWKGGAKEMGIFEIIKEIIVNQLEVKEHFVVPEAKFVEDLGADSLDIVEMVMQVEEKFGFEIPDEDMENIVTVQDLLNYIERRLGQKKQAIQV